MIKFSTFAFVFFMVTTVALGQHRTAASDTTSRVVTSHQSTTSNVNTNASRVDFDKLNAALDKASTDGEQGYQKFLELLRQQREQLEQTYGELTRTAQENVRGSLDRAQAWKDNARQEAQESLRRLDEFKTRAELKSREFSQGLTGGSGGSAGTRIRTSGSNVLTVKCQETGAGLTDEDRRHICEDYYSAAPALIANVVMLATALAFVLPRFL